MKLFKVDQRLPDAGRTTVIEASAGTGKTWMIAALAVRYIAEGRASIDQLLIVTFTRMATSELKDRIRRRFVEVHRELTTIEAAMKDRGDGALTNSVPDLSDSLVAALVRDIDGDELAARITRLHVAIGEFDQATISTIHGFCQSVLANLGITQGVAPLENLTTQLGELTSEVAHDVFIKEFVSEPVRSYTWKSAQEIVPKLADEPSTTLFVPQITAGEPEDKFLARQQSYDYATAVRMELQRRIRDRNITTYSDFLEFLKTAVGQGDTAAAAILRRRWPVVLVDEFQDTDPTQWQIFKNSFHEHSALILIGDPKQAIYGFRGADVHTYTQAVTQAHERYTLATNFRSTPALIKSFNEIWAGAQLGDGIIGREVSPSPLVRDRAIYIREDESTQATSAQGQAQADFQVRTPNKIDAAQAIDTSMAAPDFRRRITADFTRHIQELLQRGEWRMNGAPDSATRVKPEDFAVLCASNEQCDIIAQALRGVGIPVSLEAGPLAGATAVEDLQWLLSAMISPARQEIIHRVALGPFFGYQPADVLDETITNVVATQVMHWHQLLNEKGLGAVIDSATANQLPANAVKLREGERYLADLRHLAEVTRESQISVGDGPEVYLAWLEAGLQESGAERAPDIDGGAVRVITIHKSKGLQFPVVFLPFSAFGSKNVSVPYHFHDAPADHTQGLRKLVTADIYNAKSRLVKGDFRKTAEAQNSDERLRNWYVATTRAQSHIITWVVPYWPNVPHPAQQLILLNRKPGEPKPAGTIKKNDWGGVVNALKHWQHIKISTMHWEGKTSRLATDSQRPLTGVSAQKFTRTIDRTWRRTSYSGLSAEAERRRSWANLPDDVLDEPVADERIDPAESDARALFPDAGSAGLSPDSRLMVASPMANLPKGNRFGSLVHDVLEALDPGQPEFVQQLPPLVADCLRRWPVSMDDVQLDQFYAAIEAVCTTPLGPLLGGVTLADLGAVNRLPELDFDMPMAGGLNAASHYGKPSTLAQIAELLREYLEPGDPLLPYADELEQGVYSDSILQGYLTGSIDAVLRHNDSYVVVDYKTNWLGGMDEPLTLAHYGPDQLQQAMVGSSYPLQALLYAVAAHRFLRWRIADYDPARHVGGVAYLYLRGMAGPNTPVTRGQVHGVFSWKPPAKLVEKLSDLLDANGLTEQDSGIEKPQPPMAKSEVEL